MAESEYMADSGAGLETGLQGPPRTEDYALEPGDVVRISV
jgi:protein involved in polysaccharide export with SLBB domain